MSKKYECNVPIYLVIVVVTVLSTASSMAGGLVMYLRSLESLEEHVEVNCIQEMKSLEESTQSLHTRSREYLSEIRTFLYTSQIHGTDMRQWSDVTRQLFFAQIAHSPVLYFLSVELHPYDLLHNDSLFYSSVWHDMNFDKSVEVFEFAEAGPYTGTPDEPHWEVQGDRLSRVKCRTQRLNNASGVPLHYVYHFDMSADWNSYIDADPKNNIPPRRFENYTDTKATDLGTHSVWWELDKWWTIDQQVVYAYTYLDVVFEPPPPPHPWSTYRAVVFNVGYYMDTLDTVLKHYRLLELQKGDRDQRGLSYALLVHRRSGLVFGSTYANMTFVPPWCQGDAFPRIEDSRYADCYLRITDLPVAAQDVYRKTAILEFGDFTKMHLDGEEYFVRHQLMYGEVELLWFRSVSSIDEKMNEAAVMLILFASLVFFFDILTSVVELVFIGVPLRHLSTSIRAMGAMDTSADGTIKKYQNKRFMVTEIRDLMEVMTRTVRSLQEFRTFVPSAQVVPLVEKPEHAPALAEEDLSINSAKSSSLKSTISAGSDAYTKIYLVQRKVSVLLVNVVGWSKLISGDDHSKALLVHTELLTSLTYISTKHSGALDSFSGDRFFYSWNASKRTSSYASGCTATALELRANVYHAGYELSLAASCQQAKVGNIGTGQVRRFTILSPVVAWVVQLELFNKTRKLCFTTDFSILNHMNGQVLYRVVDAMLKEPTKEQKVLCEVLAMLKLAEGEWMYRLQQAERDNSFAQQNEFVKLVISGRFDIVGHPPPLPEDLQHIREAYDSREFTPLSAGFFSHA